MKGSSLTKKAYSFKDVRTYLNTKPEITSMGLLQDLLVIQFKPNLIETFSLEPNSMTI